MGSIVSDLRFRYKGGMSHLTPFPVLLGIPLQIEYVSDMESKAKYILLCGNQSGFIELAKDKVDDTFSCILVYTEEPATYWAVDFVRKMKEELDLPVLAVGDSRCDIKWLGLRPSDLESTGLSKRCMLVMRKADLELPPRNMILEEPCANTGEPRPISALSPSHPTKLHISLLSLPPPTSNFL
ncbi:hypothetical protein ACE6H2_012472 [Prunus campanulata]